MFILVDLLFLLLVFSFVTFVFQSFTGLFRRLGGNQQPLDSLKQTQAMTRQNAIFHGLTHRQEEQYRESLSISVCFSRFALQVAAADGGINQATLSSILLFFRSASPQYLEHIQSVLVRDLNNPSSIDWEYNLAEARRILSKPEWNDFEAVLFDGLLRISMADGYMSAREKAAIYQIMNQLGWTEEKTNTWFQQRGRQGSQSNYRSSDQHSDYSRQGRAPSRNDSGMSRQEAAQILGISANASPDEIKKKYRSLVREHHPDRYAQMGEEMQKSATARFQAIQQAWEILGKN